MTNPVSQRKSLFDHSVISSSQEKKECSQGTLSFILFFRKHFNHSAFFGKEMRKHYVCTYIHTIHTISNRRVGVRMEGSDRRNIVREGMAVVVALRGRDVRRLVETKA
jgi:hypothetical protein